MTTFKAMNRIASAYGVQRAVSRPATQTIRNHTRHHGLSLKTRGIRHPQNITATAVAVTSRSVATAREDSLVQRDWLGGKPVGNHVPELPDFTHAIKLNFTQMLKNMDEVGF